MMRLLIVLFCYTVLMDSCHAVSSCSHYVSVSSAASYVGYRAVYTSCWILGRCRAGTHTMTLYTTTYNQELQCCSGYGPKQSCLPICNSQCGTNMECSAPNTCTCVSGWKGSNCLTPICNSTCGRNKQCTAPDTCTCVNGWTGSDCLTAFCKPPYTCGTNEQCIAPDICICANGWTGINCSTAICIPPCGKNKQCTAPDNCTCVSGWRDSNCSTAICIPPCGKNKQCTAPDICTCVIGWTGINCSTAICIPPCGRNKQCTAPGTCTCISGWTGSNCLTAICNPVCGINKECTAPNNCTCVSGWDGYNCLSDINECSQNICHHQCTNTNGSYYCSCDTSTVLATNGIHCIGPIQNIAILDLSSTHCIITWNPPLQYMQYGSFDGYIVMCNISNTNTIITSRTTQKLKIPVIFLKPFTSYICCVTPQWTTNGIGKRQCINFTTLEDAPDDSPVNVSVNVNDGFSLQIQWEPPLIPNGIITHYTLYINYTNGSEISTRTVDSQFTLYLLDGLTPYQELGVSISATTSVGEGPQSEYFYDTTEQTEPGTIQQLTVSALSNTSVNISWEPPLLPNGIILYYSINVISLQLTLIKAFNHSVSIEPTNNLHQLIQNLNPYIPYEVSVYAVTIAGKGKALSEVFFTQETVPRVTPNIGLAQRISPTEIVVKIKPLTLEEGRGIVTGYSFNLTKSIDYCVVVDMNKLLIHTLNTSIKVGNLDPLSKYCLSVSAQTKEGHGLESQNILIPVYDNKLIVIYINGLDNCYLWIVNKTESKLTEITQVIIRVLNKFCYCSITSDYISDNILQCDSEHTIQMRVRLSAISNYTTSQLLTILQNWTGDTSEIRVDGQVLTVTSVYFLSNDTTPVLTSASTNQSSSNETTTNKNVILFSAIGSAGGGSLFLWVFCIVISVFIFKTIKTKRNYHLKPRCYEMQGKEDDTEDHYYYETETKLNNEQLIVCDKIDISPNKPIDSEDNYEDKSNITVIKNSASGQKNIDDLQDMTNDEMDDIIYEEMDDVIYEEMNVDQSYQVPVFTKNSPGKVKESATSLDYDNVSGTTAKTSTLQNVVKKSIPDVPPSKKPSEQVPSDVEQLEVVYNYSYGKTAQIPPVPSLNKASKHKTSDVQHFEMITQNQLQDVYRGKPQILLSNNCFGKSN